MKRLSNKWSNAYKKVRHNTLGRFLKIAHSLVKQNKCKYPLSLSTRLWLMGKIYNIAYTALPTHHSVPKMSKSNSIDYTNMSRISNKSDCKSDK